MIGYADGSTLKGDGRTKENPTKKYGSGGLLVDKKYMVCSTWNSPLEAFNDENQFFEGANVDEVLIQIHKSYQFLGVQKIPLFTFFDIFKNSENVAKQIDNFKEHMENNF